MSDSSMDKDMIIAESMIEPEHFIMLDVANTVSGNEFDRSYPYVQIVYPSVVNSYLGNKANESHPENGLTQKERGKYFSTIILNLDTDY
ncbi:MAG: hypothetical protein U5J96_18825 [Ignavibacteriaceae bacterium]|nr:hypothetical protein [Ignavibacteriaceae bacterium]